MRNITNHFLRNITYHGQWLVCKLDTNDIIIDSDLPYFKEKYPRIQIDLEHTESSVIFTKTKDYIQPLNSVVVRCDSDICFDYIRINNKHESAHNCNTVYFDIDNNINLLKISSSTIVPNKKIQTDSIQVEDSKIGTFSIDDIMKVYHKNVLIDFYQLISIMKARYYYPINSYNFLENINNQEYCVENMNYILNQETLIIYMNRLDNAFNKIKKTDLVYIIDIIRKYSKLQTIKLFYIPLHFDITDYYKNDPNTRIETFKECHYYNLIFSPNSQ